MRKKKNASGTVSIQIIDKSSGVYRVMETVGSSKDPNTIERLAQKARATLHTSEEIQPPLFSTILPDDAVVENFLDSVSSAHIRTIGPELIFGTLFDRIGFNAVHQHLFRHLVVARLAYPASKLKTVDYLYRYRGIQTHEDAIYRALDTLNEKHKAEVERIAFAHTQKTLGIIAVVFYDMTTLYFEAEDEDDLRKMGWSKDGKNECPQIMIGLLVGEGGYPIGYDMFEGNTFEGHTLVKTLEKIGQKYGMGKPVAIADAAMLSKKNLADLALHNYQYVVGARIRNEPDEVKRLILDKTKDKENGAIFEFARKDGTRLIVSHSEKRARHDAYRRDKGLKKLRTAIQSGRLTKEHLNNRGYNRFLAMEGEVAVSVHEERVADDTRWDGLKGYVTNTLLSPSSVIEQYGHLWQIEKAFRVSKTDLRVRPIFHRLRRRIEAHLCIAFVAYAIWKELERLLKTHGVPMSPTRAAELTHTMYEIEYTLPQSKKLKRKTLAMDGEQQTLYGVIQDD
mgnify:FL=1